MDVLWLANEDGGHHAKTQVDGSAAVNGDGEMLGDLVLKLDCRRMKLFSAMFVWRHSISSFVSHVRRRPVVAVTLQQLLISLGCRISAPAATAAAP